MEEYQSSLDTTDASNTDAARVEADRIILTEARIAAEQCAQYLIDRLSLQIGTNLTEEQVRRIALYEKTKVTLEYIAAKGNLKPGG
jgi:hypothetical protein